MLDRTDSVGCLFSIRGEQISSKDLNGATAGRWRKSSQGDGDLRLARGFAIQHEKHDLSLIGVVNRRCDDVIGDSRGLCFALRRLNFCPEDVATSVLGGELEGVEDRLAPGRSPGLRKDGSTKA